ncbi:MAG: DnaJ domain-containing protein [Microcoleaceae cyanobacterium]
MDEKVYYRTLELTVGASLEEVKASYRRLARRYHPDMNPEATAQEKFMAVAEAYKILLEIAPSQSVPLSTSPPASPETVSSVSYYRRPTYQVKVSKKEPSIRRNPQLSEIEIKLKESAYRELQHLLKHQRFPRAIALVEGLTQRIPNDPEIRQWQAITYQRWGRQLIKERQLDKARSYLKKALKTDPHNRALWAEVERDFRRLEQVY